MSIHLMSLVWEVDFATPTQKLVMLRLADYADDDGNSVFPSIERLARQVGASKRQTQYAVRALETVGLMVCLHKGGNGPKDTNRWKMDVELLLKLAFQELKLNGSHDALEAVENKGANIAPYILRRVQSAALRVQSATDKGATHCTQPSITLQKDSSLARERAEVGNFDLGTSEGVEVARAPKPAAVTFVVKAGDPQWKRWVEWYQANRPDRVGEMLAFGRITCFKSRWPSDDCIPPRIESGGPKLTPKSLAMSGEAS